MVNIFHYIVFAEFKFIETLYPELFYSEQILFCIVY